MVGRQEVSEGTGAWKSPAWKLQRRLLSTAGKLVIADTNRPILLRTKHILIGSKGELHIGSPDCPYKGNLTISLFGRYSWKHKETCFYTNIRLNTYASYVIVIFQTYIGLPFKIKAILSAWSVSDMIIIMLSEWLLLIFVVLRVLTSA